MAGRFGAGSILQGDVLAQHALQHGADIGDDFVQINVARLHDLFAAEHEQLLDEFAGAVGGGPDLAEGFFRRRRQGLGLQEQVGVALNDGEDVVEIVGDAGGQLADRLHFDGMAQLRLQGQAFGDFVGVTMDGLAFGDGDERPGNGAVLQGGVQVQFVFAGEKALEDDEPWCRAAKWPAGTCSPREAAMRWAASLE